MSGVVLLNLLSIFLTESSLKLSVSSTIQTSLIPYGLSPIIVLLKIFPFSTAIFTDNALRKSRILFLIQCGVFEPPEALPIHTLSTLHYLIHELCLTNHLSFLELLNCGTHCHLLPCLNPTICYLLNLTSTNLILSPFLLKLSLIFSVFPLSRLCYRPYGLSPTLVTKKEKKKTAIPLMLVRQAGICLHGCMSIFLQIETLLFSKS